MSPSVNWKYTLSKPENGENFEIIYDLHMFSGLLDMYFQFAEGDTLWKNPQVFFEWATQEHPQ